MGYLYILGVGSGHERSCKLQDRIVRTRTDLPLMQEEAQLPAAQANCLSEVSLGGKAQEKPRSLLGKGGSWQQLSASPPKANAACAGQAGHRSRGRREKPSLYRSRVSHGAVISLEKSLKLQNSFS